MMHSLANARPLLSAASFFAPPRKAKHPAKLCPARPRAKNLAALLCAASLLLPIARAHADAASDSAAKSVDAANGKAVFEHVCQGCHMANAKGARGAGAGFPALAGDTHLEEPGYPVSIIENGHGDMPWFNGMLTDAQVASVVNYIRTHFGNHYKDSVSPADVAAAHGPAPEVEK